MPDVTVRLAKHTRELAIGSAVLAVALLLASRPTRAQTVSPSQVTPPTLRPPQPPPQLPFIPEESPPQERLHTLPVNVEVRYVVVENGFAALADDTQDLLAPYRNRRISGEEIFALARELEQTYARHGYVLVRVIVPPQTVANGDVLRLRVVDGFIQEVDADAVPKRLRAAVLRRLSPLVGRHHLLLATLERHLLVAGELAGLHLTSALAPGSQQGGTRLLIGGAYRALGGAVSADDRLDPTLGPWEVDANLTLNSALAFGEQLYGDVLFSDPLKMFGSAPLKVYGGGAVIPVGNDGTTINPEYTYSTTRSPAASGVPATEGKFQRIALRGALGLRWRRREVLKLNLSAEAIDQRLEASAFGSDLYHDQYRVLRLGLNDDSLLAGGARLISDATLSRGLGGRTPTEASPVPLSRQGAAPEFTKLNASVRLSEPVTHGWQLDAIALGATSFGKPLLRSEQFSLDGLDALSAFTPGSLSVDQGATVRAELGRPIALRWGGASGVLSPYLVAAYGLGEIQMPTAVEQHCIHASTFGAGVRASAAAAGGTSAQFALEVARQQANLEGIHDGWRVNLIVGLRF